MFSKRTGAFPCKHAKSEAKHLLQEIIPSWGIPEKLFLAEKTGIELRQHCYHPQSGGAIERAKLGVEK